VSPRTAERLARQHSEHVHPAETTAAQGP